MKSRLKLGGDFWNRDQILRAVFRDPNVLELTRIRPLGTGLWCDADVVLNGGEHTTVRLYA